MKFRSYFCSIFSISAVVSSFLNRPAVADAYIGSCTVDLDVCTLDYSNELKPWVHDLYKRTVENRKSAENHPFIASISAGEISRSALLEYFQGMYWHGKKLSTIT